MPELHLEPLSDPVDVDAAGATLVAEAAGDGPAVVCLHAGVADRRSFRPLAPFLGDVRLIAYDRRGYGDTRYQPGANDELADLEAVLDAFDVDRAVLVGNSQGGRIALEAALVLPERVAGLVVAAPAWTGGPWPEDPPELVELGERLQAAETDGDLQTLNRLEALLWLDGPDGPEGRVEGAARELFLDMNGRALEAAEPGPQHDHGEVWPRLGSIRVPVTVVQGTLDEPGAMVLAHAAMDELADASLEVLEDVAHLPTLEVPERFADIVRTLTNRTR